MTDQPTADIAGPIADADERFNVFWWDTDGAQYNELSSVGAEQAVSAAKRMADGPASALGFVQRIIITDSGDCCNFEWIKGKGVTLK
jgi:hypothetical protein